MTYRINQIPNPHFEGSTPYVSASYCSVGTYDHSDGRRYLRIYNATASDRFCCLVETSIPAGTYRFYASRVYAYGGQGVLRLYTSSDSSSDSWGSPVLSVTVNNGESVVVSQTVSLETYFRITAAPPYIADADNTDNRIIIAEPQLELESTFDEDLPFFYYGTMPLTS